MKPISVFILILTSLCFSQPIPSDIKVNTTCTDSIRNMWAGTTKGIYKSIDSINWQKISLPIIDPDVRSILTMSDGSICAGGIFKGLLKSTDHGKNWERLLKPFIIDFYWDMGKDTSAVYPLITTNNIIFGNCLFSGIKMAPIGFFSTDSCKNWKKFEDFYDGSHSRPFYNASASKYFLYFDTNSTVPFIMNLFRIGKDGEKLIYTTKNYLFKWSLNGEIIKIAFQPGYGGISSGVVVSLDNGNTWQEQTVVVGERNHETFNYYLSQNFPNPFNPSTTIEFSLTSPGHVSLKVYSVLGKQVAELVNEQMPEGMHKAVWNAGDLANGVYYYVLQAGNYREVRKAVLIK
jgi:hypothetical protein